MIDQVCLVPDVPSFLEAISFWDERHFFPILIDSPAWRFRSCGRFGRLGSFDMPAPESSAGIRSERQGRAGEIPRMRCGNDAIRSLTRAWSPPPGPVAPLAGSDGRARRIDSESTWARADRGRKPDVRGCHRAGSRTFPEACCGSNQQQRVAHGVMIQTAPRGWETSCLWNDAWQFVNRIEAQVAAAVPHYDQLGDDCDFLTLAGDWPYRYSVEQRQSGPLGESTRWTT